MTPQDPMGFDGDDDGAVYHAMRPRSGRLRLFAAAGAVLVVLGFIAVVYYAYSEGRRAGREGVAPLIVADNTPTKVRPEQPGGMAVPDQDKLVYSRIAPNEGAPNVERLLPPPAVPLPQPVKPPVAESAADIKPIEDAKPLQKEGAAGVEKLVAAPPTPTPTPTPAPAPASSPPPAPAVKAATGGYKVQLASLRSEDGAREAWQALKKAHTDLLGDLDLTVARADLGDKGVWYRAQASGLADGAAAAKLCAELKARKVSCLPVRP